jgi:hypothetical protein
VTRRGRKARRTAEEIAAMMTGYEQSGLTRRDYCQRRGIPLSTFGYYRHQHRQKGRKPALVAVRLEASETARPASSTSSPMAVVLRNGRRIEVASGFVEAELGRLLRLVERV